MKHPPVLMLGLATLILGSASAAYAGESLSFDPTPASRSVPDRTASNATNLSPAIAMAKPPVERSASAKPPSYPANLSLSESPSFPSNSSDGSLSKSAEFSDRQEHKASSNPPLLLPGSDYSDSSSQSSTPQSSTPQSSTPQFSNIPSPFQLSDDLTDAELFESDSQQAIETDSSKSDSGSPSESKIESESTIEFDTIPSTELSNSNQLDPENNNINPINSSSSAVRTTVRTESSSYSAATRAIGLNFDLPVHSKLSASIPRSVSSATQTESSRLSQSDAMSDLAGVNGDSLDSLFKGDSDSLVAVAVGSAEGTRTPEGGKNSAYQGHTDPGNGVWNLGSFSYQHEASSPEDADAKQLARLRNQAQTILDKAAAKGLELSLEEKLNAIDLANQAPKAALDEYGGYIDWLADARSSGLGGNDAILWARVHSFLDPYTQDWNAPGLGNSEERITRDQERRMLAITKAIATYMQEIASSRSPP